MIGWDSHLGRIHSGRFDTAWKSIRIQDCFFKCLNSCYVLSQSVLKYTHWMNERGRMVIQG